MKIYGKPILLEGKKTTPAFLRFVSSRDFTIAVTDGVKTWDGTIEWSVDGESWTEWDGTTTLSSVGGVLLVRGTGNTVISGTGDSEGKPWILTGYRIRCEGDIKALLDHGAAESGEPVTPGSGCCRMLFYGATALVEGPALGLRRLSAYCYTGMFMNSGAERVSVIPSSEASTLSGYALAAIYRGCAGIRMSAEQTAEYPYPWSVPYTRSQVGAMNYAFDGTGGSCTNIALNTTYYTDKLPVGEGTT